MRMYVGNATRQNCTFTYTLPGETYKVHELHIPIGSQVMVPQDLTGPERDAILKLHTEQYGMVEVDKIDMTKHFCGTCYSMDKPIPAARMLRLMNLNIGVLEAKGKEIRKAAAVANSKIITKSLVDGGRSEGLGEFEFTIQQENHDANDPTAQISEGIRVVTDQANPPRGGRSRKAA